VTFSTELPSDLGIARKSELKPISGIASQMGIDKHFLEPYGVGVELS
jgi:hypothetical protein